MKKEKSQNQKALTQSDKPNSSTPTPPFVTGQRAEVLSLLRKGPILRLSLTVEHGIPEAPARITELKNMKFNIHSQRLGSVIFQGREYKRAALYSLGSPEWPSPDFHTDNDLPPAA